MDGGGPAQERRAHAVPLNEMSMEVLVRRQGDHLTHVFTYEGNPITQVYTKAWRNALKRAEIDDFRWHDLRHTFATWHREAGTPTHELQRLGGWKTQSMVERYAHVAPEGRRRQPLGWIRLLGPYTQLAEADDADISLSLADAEAGVRSTDRAWPL